MDMCLPLSPNISTRISEAPLTTAGTFSKEGHALTNPVILQIAITHKEYFTNTNSGRIRNFSYYKTESQ